MSGSPTSNLTWLGKVKVLDVPLMVYQFSKPSVKSYESRMSLAIEIDHPFYSPRLTALTLSTCVSP